MNRIDEEDILTVETTVDQFPSVQSPPNSSKQTNKTTNDRSKYQTTNRPSSLPPSRHSSSSLNENIDKELRKRQRYASDSNTTNPTLLVTSFLQYLRNELRATTSDQKSNYHRHKRQSSSTIPMSSNISNENSSEINDHNEILTLIDLLVLRVECLTNEKKKLKEKYPTVAEVDQNLLEYLYYLFTKFVNEESDSSNYLITPILDKNNFVNVCQTLVRNGCFDISSPDQSTSEATINDTDQTINLQTFVREYDPDINEPIPENKAIDQPETWLIVDLKPNQSEEPIANSETICVIPTSTSDEQLLSLTNDNDKSYESESSPSIYLSPNNSLIDLQTLVQEFDEINNQLIIENESTSNVIIESKTTIISNDNNHSSSNICTRLTNDDSSSIENSEEIDKMLRREKKMQERWLASTKNEDNNNEQSSTKSLIGVEFPQISVLRRKFSSSSSTSNKKKTNTDSNSSTSIEEINTSPTTIIMDNTNPDQINELLLKDVPLSINTNVSKNNDDEQLPSPVTILDEEITMKKKQDSSLPLIECQTETITNNNNELVDNQQTNNENSSIMITNPSNTNLLLSSVSSSPPLISISSTSSTLTTNENNTIEPLLKEQEEEKKEEEQRCNDEYNLDEEKKNNSSFVYDYHASGIILINDEPTQTALLQQEKKEKEEEEEEEEERERPSSPLLTLEQFNQQRTKDESPLQILSNDLNQIAMTNIDENEERYKKVEIEEIPDDEEAISTQNIDLIEPTDYIHTDDEPTKKTKSNIPATNGEPIKFDNVFSCYEKAFSKVVDTSYDESSKESSTTTQQTGEDPIALRALQRFQERMNAAAAAAGGGGGKTNTEETSSLAAKGKSSWSGSHSTPRKSLENLFKLNEQQLRSTQVSVGEESSSSSSTTTVTSPIQSESYIRPRKTFDENNYNYGLTNSVIDNQLEDQQQPSAIVENDDKRVVDNKSTANDEQIVNDTIMSNENNLQTSSIEQSGITPYRFQLEGRRRLNTLERMRERRQSHESLDQPDEKIQQIKNDYTLKPEEVQDPIIRRALERFDEKNRTLAQTKSMNYDEIQDPITRRALMRLESNLKRTIPPAPSTTTNNSNENWYTENYTLGSLQPTNDRLSRYNDSTQPPLLNNNNNNRTKYISVHQHYCTPSSNELSDLSTTNEQDIPVMRVPTQPIYVTSNNQPLTLRQRSRSEDMLSSKDLVIGQTTNLDDVDTSPSSTTQLQRNRSSNEIALNDSNYLLPSTLIKSLEPNFVRTTESSISYATPTQTYSAYSCEYTRPRRNPLITSPETSTTYKQETNQLPPPPPPTYSQQQNDIQRPTPYRPTQSSSAFTPMQSSTTTSTGNYYSQQPLPTSYNSMYNTSNNLNQSSFNEDPIVRRALERFNSQLQTSSYLSRQGNFHDSWVNPNRPPLMATSTSSTGGGYQSIIGRRRQTRYDDSNNYFIDNPSVGDAYSSSLFSNSHNPYPITNHYMNMSDEPPAIPPRFRRENYRHDDINDPYRRHSTDEYLSENINNNNNNHTLPRDAFIHHAYPATITNSTSFRPINHHYNSEQDDLIDCAQSTSSTNSSDSHKQQQQQQRLNHMKPPTGRKINEQILSNDLPPTDQTIPNNGNMSGDSVFHRLAYTGTKASLSRSNSNSCSNLLNKNSAPSQIPSNQLQTCEIDFDDSLNQTIIDHTNEQITSNKYQRSKSVDTRAKLKLSQSRSNDNNDEHNDEQEKIIPSSKFTSNNSRPPPRIPLTPTSTPRTTLTKRPSNGIRRQNSNGDMYDIDNQQQDIENDENISYNDDNYQQKLHENRMRTSIPVHRYTTNNTNIQSSQSTSSVNSNISRTKQPINLDRRDSNTSTTDSNRVSKRIDDNRLLSPNGQRRNIPVSVFAPAKLDNKRPAPAPPAYNFESQQQQQASYLSRLSANENELNSKKSSGKPLNEYSVPTDKHDNTKKMNVFERLFRGNKKKN